jgi:predicted HAD superfamily hydrolase
MNQILEIIEKKNIKVLFTDYYDTIIHRTVHPNQTQRIWAKFIIRELGLDTTIDHLYFTRIDSTKYLVKKHGLDDIELPYDILKNEVALRLINSNILTPEKKEAFLQLFEPADLKSEQLVQYLNPTIVGVLTKAKSEGVRIILISDFYGPKSLFESLLEHHGIKHLFEDIYTSSQLSKSKYKGTIYPEILNRINLKAEHALMIGDNSRSDFLKAKEAGLNAFVLPHKKYLRKNKINNLGNDEKSLKRLIESVRNNTKQKQYQPFTEYIVFYHAFIVRLFESCHKQGIKNLFFLSREGQFLKKLFDSYQEFALLSSNNVIKTHYLKISRQASLQISFKAIEDETFGYLSKYYKDLSINHFLDTFNCSENFKKEIAQELQMEINESIEGFFSSQQLITLKANSTFKAFYNTHKASNKEAFNSYMNSLVKDEDLNEISIVDIGWGGTMQESLYHFFDKNKSVTGYYLGLKEIYTIEEKTKRFGLLFSILPYTTYSDHLLMANTQLYEQFSAADHGSALGYSKEAKDFTLEHHKPEEKWLFENCIKTHQEQMFDIHKKLLNTLEPICYTDKIFEDALGNFALKTGLLQGQRKMAFLKTLSSGFYQNIGKNKVGISYEPPKIGNPVKYALAILLRPEQFFRYLVKIKPVLYNKNKMVAYFFPSYLLYLYFKFNKWTRFKVLNSQFLLKFNYFK